MVCSWLACVVATLRSVERMVAGQGATAAVDSVVRVAIPCDPRVTPSEGRTKEGNRKWVHDWNVLFVAGCASVLGLWQLRVLCVSESFCDLLCDLSLTSLDQMTTFSCFDTPVKGLC